MNPFHGTHHDYRTTLRVSQTELHINGCAGSVTVDIEDLRNQRRERIAALDSRDLAPDKRLEAVQETLERFLFQSLAP